MPVNATLASAPEPAPTASRSTAALPAGGDGDARTDAALLALARWLQGTGYRFTTATPASHAIVNARPDAGQARSLRDVFGWSRSFAADLLPARALELLKQAGLLEAREGGLLASGMRFSSLGELLLAHSAFPTEAEDSVFFGPDTYRFAALIERTLAAQPCASATPRVLDLGCGSGAGGLVAARRIGSGAELWLTDINARALRLARVNAALAGQRAQVLYSDLDAAVDGLFDLVIANPPYLCDSRRRTYRDGAGELGTGLSVRIVAQSLDRLAPGGRLLLYTGAPVVEGVDRLQAAVQPLLGRGGFDYGYEELDPDIFGEELAEPAYAQVERIAAVGLVVRRLPAAA